MTTSLQWFDPQNTQVCYVVDGVISVVQHDDPLVTDWVSAGNTIDPYIFHVFQPPSAPAQVPLWAAKAVLQATPFDPASAKDGFQTPLAGATSLLAAANILVAGQANEVLSAFWTSAANLSRQSPALLQIADALNLTPDMVDDLFKKADSIIL